MCWPRLGFLDIPVHTRNVGISCYPRRKKGAAHVSSVYQEYLAKSLTDKYGNLNVQMDKIINDANTELDSLNQKLAGRLVIPFVGFLQLTTLCSNASRPGEAENREHKSRYCVP